MAGSTAEALCGACVVGPSSQGSLRCRVLPNCVVTVVVVVSCNESSLQCQDSFIGSESSGQWPDSWKAFEVDALLCAQGPLSRER